MSETDARPTRRRCRSCGRFIALGFPGELCVECSVREAEAEAASPTALTAADVEWPPPLPDEIPAAPPPLPERPRELARYAEVGVVIPRPSQLHGGDERPLAPGYAGADPVPELATQVQQPMRSSRRAVRLTTQLKVVVVIGVIIGILVPFLLSR